MVCYRGDGGTNEKKVPANCKQNAGASPSASPEKGRPTTAGIASVTCVNQMWQKMACHEHEHRMLCRVALRDFLLILTHWCLTISFNFGGMNFSNVMSSISKFMCAFGGTTAGTPLLL